MISRITRLHLSREPSFKSSSLFIFFLSLSPAAQTNYMHNYTEKKLPPEVNNNNNHNLMVYEVALKSIPSRQEPLIRGKCLC